MFLFRLASGERRLINRSFIAQIHDVRDTNGNSVGAHVYLNDGTVVVAASPFTEIAQDLAERKFGVR